MPTKRTTHKPVDIDALIKDKLAKNVASAEIRTFILGGREWHAQDVSSQAALFLAFTGGGDADALMDYLFGMIVEEERDEFKAVLTSMRGMNDEVFSDILSTVVEAVTARPTEPPSASPVSSAKKAGAPSTVDSSLPVEDVLPLAPIMPRNEVIVEVEEEDF